MYGYFKITFLCMEQDPLALEPIDRVIVARVILEENAAPLNGAEYGSIIESIMNIDEYPEPVILNEDDVDKIYHMLRERISPSDLEPTSQFMRKIDDKVVHNWNRQIDVSGKVHKPVETEEEEVIPRVPPVKTSAGSKRKKTKRNKLKKRKTRR